MTTVLIDESDAEETELRSFLVPMAWLLLGVTLCLVLWRSADNVLGPTHPTSKHGESHESLAVDAHELGGLMPLFSGVGRSSGH